MSEVKLTKAQEDLIPVYRDQYIKIGLNTDPCDRAKAEAAVLKCYDYMKIPRPTQIYWADSPTAGSKISAELQFSTKTPTREQIQSQAEHASFGSIEAYWVSFYAFVTEVLGHEDKEGLVAIAKDIVSNCGVYWTLDGAVVLTERPVEIHIENEVLHNPNGHAIKYRDGTGFYAYKGKDYPNLAALKLAVLGGYSEE